mgnify:CR=1 FL=1
MVDAVRIPKDEDGDWMTQMDLVAREAGMTIPFEEIPCEQVPMLAGMGVGYLRDERGVMYTAWKDRTEADPECDVYRLSVTQ